MADRSELDDLLGKLELPSSKGRRATPLGLEVVRELTEDDLGKLEAGEGAGLATPPLVKLRHSHHQLAQLLARGVEATEASLITGYALTTISILRQDPSFRELLSTYASEREAIFVEVVERMKTLGLSSLDELQDRLEEDPKGWTKRELMELADLCLVKPQQQRSGATVGPGVAGGVSVEIKFVEAQQTAKPAEVDIVAGVVDLEFEDSNGGSEG